VGWRLDAGRLAGVRDHLDLVPPELPATVVLHRRQEPAVDELQDPVRRHAEDHLGGPAVVVQYG
jgi:hypothetical protein